jgi:uncharacterized protein YecT (DUF1311 family)
MNRNIRSFAAITFAVVLTGCNQIPSCGDQEALKSVSDIMGDILTADAGDYKAEIKKRAKFNIEQPIILAKNDKTGNYSCKAVANYVVADSTNQMLKRTSTDPKFQEKLGGQWRKLTGLFTYADVLALAEKMKEGSPADQQHAREELADMLGLERTADLPTIFMAITGANQNSKETAERTQSLVAAISSIDNSKNVIPIEITYTIAKIDSKKDRDFLVEVSVKDGHNLQGISDIEFLVTANGMVEQGDKQSSVAAVKAVPAAVPATPAVASTVTDKVVAEAKPAEVAVAKAEPAVQVPQSASVQPVSMGSSANAAASKEIVASFDCAKATAKIEKLICSTLETAASDKKLAVAYGTARAKATDPAQLKAEQLQWIKTERNVCEDAACLIKATDARIQKLSAL